MILRPSPTRRGRSFFPIEQRSGPVLKSPKVILALVLVQVLFSTLPVVVKVALRALSSPALALLRVTGAAVLFLILQRAITRERIHSWRDYGLLALYSLF